MKILGTMVVAGLFVFAGESRAADTIYNVENGVAIPTYTGIPGDTPVARIHPPTGIAGDTDPFVQPSINPAGHETGRLNPGREIPEKNDIFQYGNGD